MRSTANQYVRNYPNPLTGHKADTAEPTQMIHYSDPDFIQGLHAARSDQCGHDFWRRMVRHVPDTFENN
jgi:hypothetical protein